MKKIKKDKKENKKFNISKVNPIFMFIFGIIISLTTVYAYDIVASNIGFTPPSGMSSSITNVQSAINEVYAESTNYNAFEEKINNIHFLKIRNDDGKAVGYYSSLCSFSHVKFQIEKGFTGYYVGDSGYVTVLIKSYDNYAPSYVYHMISGDEMGKAYVKTCSNSVGSGSCNGYTADVSHNMFGSSTGFTINKLYFANGEEHTNISDYINSDTALQVSYFIENDMVNNTVNCNFENYN